MELRQPQSAVYDLNLYEWRLHAPFAPDNARLVYLLCDEAHYRDTERRLSSITLRGPIRSLTRQNDSSLVYSLPLRAGLSDTDLAQSWSKKLIQWRFFIEHAVQSRTGLQINKKNDSEDLHQALNYRATKSFRVQLFSVYALYWF